jgi:lysophospholipase L1-like esterase
VWYRAWVKRYDPNVAVLLAGRWEVDTRTYEGKWTNITNPVFAAYVKQQLDYTVGLLSAKGARVVLVTAPFYTEGKQPDGTPYPQDSRARIKKYNSDLFEIAAQDKKNVTVLNLNAIICPGGHYEAKYDGVRIRSADGVHFTFTGTQVLAPKIWPIIAKVGREQIAASAAGAPAETSTSAPTG